MDGNHAMMVAMDGHGWPWMIMIWPWMAMDDYDLAMDGDDYDLAMDGDDYGMAMV